MPHSPQGLAWAGDLATGVPRCLESGGAAGVPVSNALCAVRSQSAARPPCRLRAALLGRNARSKDARNSASQQDQVIARPS